MFGEGAEGRARDAEVDTAAVFKFAYAVDSRNEGEQPSAAIVSAFGKGFDDGVQSSGGYGDETFSYAGDGVVKARVAGRGIERLDDSGVHEVPRFYRIDCCGPTDFNYDALLIGERNGMRVRSSQTCHRRAAAAVSSACGAIFALSTSWPRIS